MSTTARESGGNSNTGDAPPAYSDPVEEVKHPDGPTPSYPGAPGAAPAPGYALPPYASPQYIQQGQPMQYMTMSVTPKPAFPGPHSFMVLVIIVMIVCGLLNILSVAFGIPAFLCALICLFKVSEGQYPSATKYSMASFILTLLNIVFTMLVGAMITGISIWYSVIAMCRYLNRYTFGLNEEELYCSKY